MDSTDVSLKEVSVVFSPILSLESYSVEFLVISFDESAIGYSSELILLLWSYVALEEV